METAPGREGISPATAIALVIQGLLSLFPSLTSFNSAFGHSR